MYLVKKYTRFIATATVELVSMAHHHSNSVFDQLTRALSTEVHLAQMVYRCKLGVKGLATLEQRVNNVELLHTEQTRLGRSLINKHFLSGGGNIRSAPA
jgi:hypothetical protein